MAISISKAGQALREYRAQHQLTQTALAQLLDVAQSHVSDLERGLKSPSVSLAARVERLAGIPAAQWAQ